MPNVKMRILQVNKFFYERGGTERYFFSVSRALEKRGHTVSHFAMRHPNNVESPFARFFVSERDYAGKGTRLDDIPAGLAFIRSREAARHLERLVENHKPDVAHLHNIYHQITPSIIPVLKRSGVPIVMTLHDYKLICPNYSLFDGKAYCYRCRGRRFHRAATTRCRDGSFMKSLSLSIEASWQKLTRVYDNVRFFVAPSRYIHDVFVAEGFRRDCVVYLAPFVRPDELGAGSSPGATALDGLPNRYVVYFGRLSVEKGLSTLLDAIGRLARVPLVVCGDGPLRKTLEEQASGLRARVHFTGHLGRHDLYAVVHRAVAAVLPSESPENAPYTVLEAMAMGVPVVVSNMGGLPELARTGGGIVFTAGDAVGLAETLHDMWDNKSLAEDIGRRGRHSVAEHFGEERHLDGLEDVYRKAIGVKV
jgi:glycosyltransferase involved in cell wall biosynthesis